MFKHATFFLWILSVGVEHRDFSKCGFSSGTADCSWRWTQMCWMYPAYLTWHIVEKQQLSHKPSEREWGTGNAWIVSWELQSVISALTPEKLTGCTSKFLLKINLQRICSKRTHQLSHPKADIWLKDNHFEMGNLMNTSNQWH